MRRTTVLVLWLAGLLAALLVLLATDRGALAGPPPLDPGSWPAWSRARDPVDAAVAMFRSGLVLVVVHLLVTTLLGLVARVAALPRLLAGMERAGGPLVRRVLSGAVGVGLALSTLAPVAASAQSGPPSTAVMRLLPEEPTTTTTTAPPTSVPPQPAAAPVAPAAPEPPPSDDHLYLVQPGDSFWRIAQRHLASRTGRTPSERELARYWRDLVAANRDRLVAPSEPDLVYPGQQFRLPQ